MALQMWLRDDIRNVLLGLELSSAQATAGMSDEVTHAYRLGFQTALTAAALSFGITLLESEADASQRSVVGALLPAQRAR